MPERPPPLLARQHALLEQFEPVLESVGRPQVYLALPAVEEEGDGAVRPLVLPFDPVDVHQLHFEQELAHLGDAVRARCPTEAVQVVPGQDEVALLPAAEEFVALLPEEAALDGVRRVLFEARRRQ